MEDVELEVALIEAPVDEVELEESEVVRFPE